ncbi:MAG: restriction endonuclease subunit S [Bacillota bacterium]
MTEGPYILPEGWRWVRLGEACEINPRRPRLHVDPNEPTTFVPMTAVDDQAGTIVTPEVRPFEQVRQGYTYFEEGDVLLAKITPCMENGKAAIARGLLNGFGFGSTEFHVLRPGGSVIPEWIWLFIRQERFRKAAKASFRGGVGQQRVPKEFLEHHPIPLPPLDEQRRIVARLEELMSRVREAKRLRQQAKEDAEYLMQAALAEVFPRPGAELPPGWRWVRLGEVAKAINGCGFPKRYQGQQTGPVAFLKVSDLNNPKNDPEVTRAANYVDENTLKFLHGRACKPGTIVFPKIGGAIATNKKRKLGITAAFDNNVMGLLPNEEVVSSDYLLLWTYTIDLTSLSKVGPVPSIRQSTVENQRIPLPPLPEQCRIVAHLEAVWERVRALKQTQEETAEHLNDLERSILDKAFRGEL